MRIFFGFGDALLNLLPLCGWSNSELFSSFLGVVGANVSGDGQAMGMRRTVSRERSGTCAKPNDVDDTATAVATLWPR